MRKQVSSGHFGWQASSVLVLVASLFVYGSFAAEKLTPENVSGLIPQLFQLHLIQHEMTPDFTKRILKEYLTQLDPLHRFYLKSEADAIVNKSEEELKKIGDAARNADFGLFRSTLENYLNTQIARDAKLYEGLETRADEVKKEAERRESGRKTATGANPENPAKPEDDDEDLDKIKWTERPATDEERVQRLIKSAAAMYSLNKSYLSEKEAFRLALQNVAEARKIWLKTDVEADTPKLFLKAFMGAMDPHTVYFDGDDEQFGAALEPTFIGIGVKIRPCPGGAQIEEIIPGGPTEKSGKIMAGDQIVAVDGNDLTGLPINKIVLKIKGKKDTDVRLTVVKRLDKSSESITLRREEIQLAPDRVKAKLHDTPVGAIGLISVQNFYRNVSKDVKEAIQKLNQEKPLAGLVLDLRYNQGGYLEEAVNLTGLFIETGPVVGERDGKGRIDWKYDFDNFAFNFPLVVLTSQFSASASEIVAGSLKDYSRAVIVGPTQSFGKGSVQRVIPLSTVNLPGEIKITTHQYFVAGGGSTQLKGVEPDVTIKGSKLVEDVLEKAAENAVPWNQIPSRINPSNNKDVARWSDWKKNNVAQLQEKSKKRVEADKKYQDFFDLKKRKEKALAEKAEADKRNPNDPPPVAKKKDEEDPQAGEAVSIAADMATTWNGDKSAANKGVENPIK